jgi:hypothetical protein
MRDTPTQNAPTEAAGALEQLARELREHERARLELVLRHECELADAEACHQAACSALQARSASIEQTYRECLLEVATLTRMVVDLQVKTEALSVQLEATTTSSSSRLDELRSTIEARDAALADAKSCFDAAEEELAAVREVLTTGRREGAGSPAASAPGMSDTALLRGSALFDAAWYRRRYPDVDGAGMDPVAHYLLHGAAELRDPGPAFSTAAYLGAHPDVGGGDANALVHYLRVGLREGRSGRLPVLSGDGSA